MNGKDWWRGASIYQIYPRSFLDTNGDGVGDLKGATQMLDHVAWLGVDAVWLSPFYVSPMRDFGYDVSDHTAVDPLFGTGEDAERFIARAHELGLKVMLDFVAGHTSDQHPWFVSSRSQRDGPHADWYHWADPQPDGTPPNNWLSVFSGPAWAWEPRRRQYYLHHFLAQQPSLDTSNPAVQDALLGIARFWLDRGVDGLRLDAIDFLAHDPLLRSNPASGIDPDQAPAKLFAMQKHDNDMLHPGRMNFLQRLREVADAYGAVLLGEVSSQPGAFERIAEYTGPVGPLQTAYTLAPMRGAFDRAAAEGFAREAARADSSPCWAFSNHDTTRVASRWCLTEGRVDRRKLELVAALQMALRGQVCVYQGEELGLTDAELDLEHLRDPFGIAYWPEFKGRDGSRTPMPWRPGDAGLGFTAGKPWLPLGDGHAALTVEAQKEDWRSFLNRFQDLLQWRRNTPEIRLGDLRPLALPEPLVGFERSYEGRRTLCVFNLSDARASLDLQDGRGPIALDAWDYRLLSGSAAIAKPRGRQAVA
ncbi:alpha-glucosidase [Alsobacter soli]|uniref:Alpha-glucosidase n=1 Tax=Alsobacter soli TaxID=2109933 RepID=A0A2T1HV56_9HYPH|nr:alpha-glucosidase [Alsobacter soli]PSC05521.1 alpha-glucosidase [Alsobacter soli]